MFLVNEFFMNVPFFPFFNNNFPYNLGVMNANEKQLGLLYFFPSAGNYF